MHYIILLILLISVFGCGLDNKVAFIAKPQSCTVTNNGKLAGIKPGPQ